MKVKGGITEFSADNQAAMDLFQWYLNLKLTPEGFAALSGPITFEVQAP